MSKRQKSRLLLRRITVTAVLIALAVVIKCFTKIALTIPGVGIQVSFGGIFTFFPAILFGPLYGGIASAMCDFLGAMIAPTGAYIPWLTLTAFAGGFLKGLLWHLIVRSSGKRMIAVLLTVLILIGGLGASFTVALNRDGITDGIFAVQEDLPTKDELTAKAESGELSVLSRAAVSLSQYSKNSEKNPDNYRKNLAQNLNLVTAGLELFSLIGLALIGVSVLLRHFKEKKNETASPYWKILATILIPGLIETSVNTYILKLFVSSYASRSLLILWVPRVCEELAVCAIQAIFISILYGVLLRTSLLEKE